MTRTQADGPHRIAAIKVHQWLREWDSVDFDPTFFRGRPQKHFYLFTLSASHLRSLSGIYTRTVEDRRLGTQGEGIQRRHDERRSSEIRRFVRSGYPWSDLSEAKRESGQYDDLIKPGWLPTAIIVNIIKPGNRRRGREVGPGELVTIEDEHEQSAVIRLPDSYSGPDWQPTHLPPIEVIDGQHRLWAFDDAFSGESFELPVVAFHGLDVSWQAYLFYTINIKPRKINASLAFDLYPLLRTEDWLDRVDELGIYRQPRAQELTEALYAYPESPWFHRINLLGERGMRHMVSQAAWIRALTVTYVRSWENRSRKIGGLFGGKIGGTEAGLPWKRAQQAAFLIAMGQTTKEAVARGSYEWSDVLRQARENGKQHSEEDPAFFGANTLLSTDQGIRGLLHVTNDLCYMRASQLELDTWAESSEESTEGIDVDAITAELQVFRGLEGYQFLVRIAEGLASYDWRTSSAPGLSNDESTFKAAFRGSGGYKELRRQLLRHLGRKPGDVGDTAQQVSHALRYD